MTTTTNDWTLSMATGGKPVVLPYSTLASNVFLRDGRYNIVVLTFQVRVYFLSTRQCIRTIACDCSDVVDARLDEELQHLLLFTSNGEVVSINWKDKVANPIVSRTQLALELPLESVVAAQESGYVVVCGRKSRKPHTRTLVRVGDEAEVLAEVSNVITYGVSHDHLKIVFVTTDNTVVLLNVNSTETTKETMMFPYRSPVISVAVSLDATIALGTVTGVIQVLYGGLVADKPQRLFKWHVDQVRSLMFTPDNNYLLSGGLEKVLVFWNLDTEKTQFLPRLSGTIERIGADPHKEDHYTLLLRVNGLSDDVSADSNHEVLVISAVDLVLRLSVNAVRPRFSTPLRTILKGAKKERKKEGNEENGTKNGKLQNGKELNGTLEHKDVGEVIPLKQDLSAVFEVHPKTKNLYFPNESTIQAYDLVKNEQSFVQTAAPLVQTGKVRSESKLLDPVVTHIAFSHDGEWMCTFDTVATSEVDNLLSKDDKEYALKFWKFIESSSAHSETTVNSLNNKQGFWELSTKIIDPHGSSNPVFAIEAAPADYHQGLAFLTADDKGGLRVWRPRVPKEIYQQVKSGARLQQTAWTMRKLRPPAGALASPAVSACWSSDGSIIVVAHESLIHVINTQTFEEVPSSMFRVPALLGSRIRAVHLVDNHLIVLSKTRIASFNLLTGTTDELAAQVSTTQGARNLIAVDHSKCLVCLVTNHYAGEDDTVGVHSKIMVFRPDQLQPVVVKRHAQAIASVRSFNSSFIFVDMNLRVGVVLDSAMATSHDIDLTDEMQSMLATAQATADVINSRNVAVKTNKRGKATVDTESSATLDLSSFQPIFENVDGVPLENLFERIMKVIK